MDAVDMHEAKTRLSALVDAVEMGRETEIVIARNGRPAARLVPLEKKKLLRLGLGEGRLKVPALDEWNRDEDHIAALFDDGSLFPDRMP